jgi:endonuclease VIII
VPWRQLASIRPPAGFDCGPDEVPEGDTVWLAARRLNNALGGRVLTECDFRVPALATADLAGHTVLEVAARGKHLLTRFDDGRTLHTHFRLEGSWRIFRPGIRWTGGPSHDIRAILGNIEWTAVGYRLPVIELLATDCEGDVVGHLGPDLLGEDWDENEAVSRLAAVPDREIGDALLDQRNLAGIGNLYKTETLFLTGISPWTPVADVPDLPALVRRTRKLMTANRNHPEQSTTGNLRRGQDRWVFERTNQPCRRCGTRIRSGTQGEPPYDRLCYWCPSCQRGLSP